MCFWHQTEKKCVFYDAHVHVFRLTSPLSSQTRVTGGGQEKRLTLRPMGWSHSCGLARGEVNFYSKYRSSRSRFVDHSCACLPLCILQSIVY